MRNKRKPRVIHIHGRRWFKSDTYHTVTIWVDGVHVHKSERTPGYGHHYQQTAEDWLSANGYLPGFETEHTTLWHYCDQRGIRYVDEVDDVARRKDL